jgi:hypothetical protein
MMTEALLLIWLGFGSAQTLSTSYMPTMETCERALAALRAEHNEFRGEWSKCIPIGTPAEREGPTVPRD